MPQSGKSEVDLLVYTFAAGDSASTCAVSLALSDAMKMETRALLRNDIARKLSTVVAVLPDSNDEERNAAGQISQVDQGRNSLDPELQRSDESAAEERFKSSAPFPNFLAASEHLEQRLPNVDSILAQYNGRRRLLAQAEKTTGETVSRRRDLTGDHMLVLADKMVASVREFSVSSIRSACSFPMCSHELKLSNTQSS